MSEALELMSPIGHAPGADVAPHRRLPDPLTIAAALVLAGLFLAGIAGQLSLLGDPSALISGARLKPPSAALPFGADDLGRSMLPRVLQGIGNTLVTALLSISISVVVATSLAMIAGYFKGLADRTVVAIADILFSFPALLLAILVAAILGPGRTAALAAIIFVTLPRMIRVIRQSVIAIAERDFVLVAEVSGLSRWRIILSHILPNVAGPIVVQATFALSVAMLVESGLSFLGLGLQPPSASLGSLVALGLDALALAPWLVLIPGAVLVTAIVATNLVGDGLRDWLEPREIRSLR